MTLMENGDAVPSNQKIGELARIGALPLEQSSGPSVTTQ
jgi:hypothetical protein